MVNNFKKLSIKKVSKVAFNMFAICFISVICLMGAKTVYAEEGKKTISAKEQMEQEEKYIVDLVSQRTIQNLTTANWRECLCYLREHYDSLMKEEGIETNKIQSYVNAYTFVEMDEKEPEEKTNFFIETYAAYSPAKVTAYTNKYWKNYNSAYPNFTSLGGDCANFVSQALYAGGKTMKGTVASDFSNWFCRTKSINELSKVSSTWRGADAFGHYWMANAKKYKNFAKSYFSSKDNFKTVFNYGSVGDAISLLNSNGRPYHTLIISYKEDAKLKFASHTGNHKWKSLYKYVREMGANGVRIYKM